MTKRSRAGDLMFHYGIDDLCMYAGYCRICVRNAVL